MGYKKHVAFVIAGAGSLIGQELALCKALVEGLYPGAKAPILPGALAGASAGALSCALLNGIIKWKRKKGDFSWDVLEREILFPMRNEDVYKDPSLLNRRFFNDVNAFIQIIEKLSEIKKLNAEAIDDFQKILKRIAEGDITGILKEHFSDCWKIHKECWDILLVALDLLRLLPGLPKDVSSLNELWRMVQRGYVLDTSPLKKTLRKFVVEKDYLGFHKLGDVFIPTSISAVDYDTGATRRFNSQDKDDAELDMVQVLMGSSAIPALFPKQNIGYIGSFVDGGTGTDDIPIEALAGKDKFDEIYIITPKDSVLLGETRRAYSNFPLLANIVFAFNISFFAIAPFQLYRALGLVKNKENAFIYMPEIKTNYHPLDFDKSEEQFKETSDWAGKNPPKRILDFLEEHDFKLQDFSQAPKSGAHEIAK